MDTRQLAAFCAVVEKKSFSQAAERLGVTQPAVSLQIRALEKRLGVQLLDRSGRRVELTEAGARLYRNAQRLLAVEEQLLDELGEDERLAGRLELGASTGPGGSVVPVLLGELYRRHPDVSVALTVADTHRVVELVADRALELGVVGFARRHRSVTFEVLFRDEVVLACPPGHPFAGKTIALDDLKSETLILMQEGAGVREAIEDELRAHGARLRDFDVLLATRRWEAPVDVVGRWSELPTDAEIVPGDAEVLLALGGGSTIDTAKRVSAESGLPLVCVPTTYSGAEWTHFFGVRDHDRRLRGGGDGSHNEAIVYDVEIGRASCRERV